MTRRTGCAGALLMSSINWWMFQRCSASPALGHRREAMVALHDQASLVAEMRLEGARNLLVVAKGREERAPALNDLVLLCKDPAAERWVRSDAASAVLKWGMRGLI